MTAHLPVLVIVVLIAFAIAPSPASAEFRAGAAFRVVTPDPLLPVTGGAGGTSPATKKLGELTVRVLAMEQDGTRVAIVGTDFLGFPGVLAARVRAHVKNVPPENILIGATHTHSAPDLYGFVNKEGKCSADLSYIESVCAKTAEAVNEAVEKLQPASIKIATDKAHGKIAYNYYAPQLYDPRMSVIQVLGKKKAIATLVNYATHPEIIGDNQGILSPDLCGPLYDRIEEKGGGMGLFMNGAQGGMVTADCRGPAGDIQTWDECIRIGHLMADEALRIAESAAPHDNPKLFCAALALRLPIDSDLLLAILAHSPLGYKANEDRTISTQVNLVNIGNAQILTIPGEALPNVGYYLKRKMHGRHNLLFGLTNDAFGYMPCKVDWNSFDRYKYISETCLGEMTAEIYMQEALAFADRSPRPEEWDEK